MVGSRVSLRSVTPEIHAAMRALDSRVKAMGLDPTVVELVKIRASQINGCLYCIDLHVREARAAGEAEERIYALSAWQESPLFDQREATALALCEAITLIADSRVPEETYRRATDVFDEVELATLIWTIVTINAWNRVAISTRMLPPSQTNRSSVETDGDSFNLFGGSNMRG